MPAPVAAPSKFFLQNLCDLQPAFRAFARALARDPEDALDLVQEANMKAIEKHATFQPGTNMKAWLFGMLRNLYFDEFRKYSTRPTVSFDLYADDVSIAALAVPPAQEWRVAAIECARSFEKLPASRQRLLLRAMDDVSRNAMAREAKCSVGAIKSRLCRARRALRDVYDSNTGTRKGPFRKKPIQQPIF